MDAAELHKLARVLREIATAATTEAGEKPPSPGVLAIAEDLSDHPETSIAEIVARTGFAQSMVSKIVSQMAARGLVTASPDPRDGRRVLLSIDKAARKRVFAERGRRPITAALRTRLPESTDDTVARAMQLLDELAGHLLPSR